MANLDDKTLIACTSTRFVADGTIRKFGCARLDGPRY